MTDPKPSAAERDRLAEADFVERVKSDRLLLGGPLTSHKAAFCAGWDAAIKSSPEVLGLVEALKKISGVDGHSDKIICLNQISFARRTAQEALATHQKAVYGK